MDQSIFEMLFAGARLMVVGMAIVYLFLALLVWIIQTLAKVVQHDGEPTGRSAPMPSSNAMDEVEPEVVAAITAAIHESQRSSLNTEE